MNLTKDIYEYLTKFADDETILNMLSVNKKFSEPDFFRNVLNRKYPYLSNHKNKNESWRQFYVKMIYYISKLAELEVPYISTQSFNPETFYKTNFNRKINMLNEALFYSTLAKRKDLIDYFIKKRNYSINNYNNALGAAASVGSRELVDFFISKGAKDINNALLFAAESGHLDIVKYLIDNGAKSIGLAINEAKNNNHEEIVEYLQKIKQKMIKYL